VAESQESAVDATAEEIPADAGAPMPSEAAEAIEEYIPGPAELAVVDPSDRHEVMLSMDEHDVRMLLERVQSSALRKWVYELPFGGGTGLTVHAVQDITQMMNWLGKCRIGVLPETLEVEQITQDAGNGPEPFWVATIFARDEMTGAMLPGSSTEPQRMRLKKSTADKKRNAGQKIPEDNTIFDVFSRTKAIQKATRNALASFIPEEVEQTVIAMFEKDPARVERIQTEAEAKVAEMPPPLTDDKARALVAQCESIYDEIRELGGGQGKVHFTPGLFSSWMLQSQHDHGALERFVVYLEQRREEIRAQLAGGAS
jgi:hypothetical protein